MVGQLLLQEHEDLVLLQQLVGLLLLLLLLLLVQLVELVEQLRVAVAEEPMPITIDVDDGAPMTDCVRELAMKKLSM